MQINKSLIISILLLIIGCKKENSNTQKNNVHDTTKIQKHQIGSTNSDKINDFIKESIVVSCGSGCAISYSPEDITQFNKTIKVKFKVVMYEDQVITDTYYEIYNFFYNQSNDLIKIQLDSNNDDVLKSLSADAQESFRDFGNKLIQNRYKDTISPPIAFLYNKKTDPKTADYQLIETSSIKGLNKYSCGEQKTRYISLPSKSDIRLILIPQDCGDFEYRYYLLTIKNDNVIGNLYVEGIWYEPEDEDDKEITTFSIDEEYNLVVKNQTSESSKLKRYVIKDDGNIIEQ